MRATPVVTRRAIAAHCCGSSGASVTTIATIEPAPGGAAKCSAIGLSSASAAPTGTPAIVSSPRSPKFAWTSTPTE